MIFDKIKAKSLVFDVGCASGYFAELLVKKKHCQVIGLEIDEEDAKKAEVFCKTVLRDDVESESWEGRISGKKFDHIIFADVLEHLKDPEKVLVRMKKFLKSDGSILVSIPNIAHISVRLELLGGNFVPESTGILDNTHLKYFTKETFSELAKRAGYKISDIFQSSFDFPEDKLKEILSEFGLSANEASIKKLVSNDAVAYQYFFELSLGEAVSTNENPEMKKPIYIVRAFLKSVEDDHRKFKEEEIKNVRLLQEENRNLQKRITSLENTLPNRLKSRLKKLLKVRSRN